MSTQFDRVARAAGLEVMSEILDILRNRETVGETRLTALTAEDVSALYEGYIGPAIDAIESALLSH